MDVDEKVISLSIKLLDLLAEEMINGACDVTDCELALLFAFGMSIGISEADMTDSAAAVTSIIASGIKAGQTSRVHFKKD